jgi:hypothetical protein
VEIIHTKESVNCVIITLQFLLASPHRVKHLKESMHCKFFIKLVSYYVYLMRHIKKAMSLCSVMSLLLISSVKRLTSKLHKRQDHISSFVTYEVLDM